MRKFFTFFLVVAITGAISGAGACPEPVGPSEIETTSVTLAKKVPLPRPFFRFEKEVWVRNYIPKEGAVTATGDKAEWGVVAVDPKKIPLGSIVYLPADFPGQKFVARDTGGFSGWKIDLCRNPGYPKKLAKKWGKKKMRITIIKPFALRANGFSYLVM